MDEQARALLLFVTEVVDLASADEMTPRMTVIRDAIVRWITGEPLDEDELRARLAS